MNDHSVHKKSAVPSSSHLRVALLLLAITGVVALLLGIVNGLTKGRIAAFAEEKAVAARTAVLPDAADFENLDYADGVVLSAYKALDADGKLIGFAIETAADGFGGTVDQMVGISADSAGTSIFTLSVSGVELLDISDETPGVGTKVSMTSFLSQFIGMDAASLAADYDAVSGASYSSEGVRTGVEAALTLVESIVKENGGRVQ